MASASPVAVPSSNRSYISPLETCPSIYWIRSLAEQKTAFSGVFRETLQYYTMTKNKGKKEKLVIGVLFFFALFSFGNKVYGADLPMGATMSFDGKINFSVATALSATVGNNLAPDCPKLRYHVGIYPADNTGTAMATGVCAFYNADSYHFFLTATGYEPTPYDFETAFSPANGEYWFSIEGNDRYYFTATRTGGSWSYIDGANNTSRIITTTPYNGQTIATSTTNTIGATGYLSAEDLNDYSKLKIHIENSANSFLNCADVICAGLSANAISRNFEKILLTAGSFTFSSTTTGLPIGKYYLTATIEKGDYCAFEFCLLTTKVFSTTTTFIVASTTKADKLKESVINYMAGITGTEDDFNNCTVTSFSFLECMSDLFLYAFIPTESELEFVFNQFYTDALIHFPLGYITDFISIISTTTVGTLTPIDAYIPNGVPGTGAHIRLDLTNGLDMLLNATTSQFNNVSASSTQTFYEYTSYYWNLILYIMAGFYIIRRILGSHLIPKF